MLSLHFMFANSSHGTKCAGVIVGAESGVCGRGVAYDAQISGNWFRNRVRRICSWFSETLNEKNLDNFV